MFNTCFIQEMNLLCQLQIGDYFCKLPFLFIFYFFFLIIIIIITIISLSPSIFFKFLLYKTFVYSYVYMCISMCILCDIFT